MLIECTFGPVSTEVAGTTYTFQPDEFGRCVAEVWVPRHISALLAVVHYRKVEATPVPPTLLSIEPSTAEIGAADLVLVCNGTDFAPESVIVFNGGDEPTSFLSATQLSTVVKPSTATTAGDFPVLVRLPDGAVSEPLAFSFTAPAGTRAAASRGVDLEDDEEEEVAIPLTDINGIGPALATKLEAEGITDARQIAKMTKAEATALDEKLGLSGRIARDEWIKQAKALAR